MLILVRHGRTAANAGGLLLGRLDPPLDEVGRRQAEALAAALPAGARLVSSPLRRARQTAEAIAAGGTPVEIDDRWVELDYGEYDGVPLGDVPSEVWARWRAEPGFAPSGGESLADLGTRVRAACDDLVPVASGADVVVVSHVSPIKAAVAWALGVGDGVSWRTHLDPASITTVGIGPRGPVLRGFNERTHLG
ncbi:MAG: histidine phosphatase family protein [Acidimicrobiales bacterium]|nr:histidine phosphatase family protein [Acidimicrobiales bacterium]